MESNQQRVWPVMAFLGGLWTVLGIGKALLDMDWSGESLLTEFVVEFLYIAVPWIGIFVPVIALMTVQYQVEKRAGKWVGWVVGIAVFIVVGMLSGYCQDIYHQSGLYR